MAKGIPLGSGDFLVILAKDKGLLATFKQLIHAWKGDLADFLDSLGIRMIRTKFLRLILEQRGHYFVNVDGQLRKGYGQSEWRVFGKIKLITGEVEACDQGLKD